MLTLFRFELVDAVEEHVDEVVREDFETVPVHRAAHAERAENLVRRRPDDGTDRPVPLHVLLIVDREATISDLVEFGLTIECLLADRAFASAAGIEAMQTTAPMIAPLIRRGKELAELLETHVSYWSEYAMYEGTAREVRFPLAICVSYQKGKRGKTGLLVRAYAACKQDTRTPKQVEQAYKQRSAIETSFRTFREALAKITTRDPGIRLV